MQQRQGHVMPSKLISLLDLQLELEKRLRISDRLVDVRRIETICTKIPHP